MTHWMFRVFTANIRHNRPLTKMSASTLWLFYLLHTDATRPQVSEWQLFEWPTKAEKFPTFHFPSQPPPLRQFGGLDSALLRLLKAGGVNLANSSDKGKCVNSHLGLQLWVSRHIANTGLIVTRAVSAIAELVFSVFVLFHFRPFSLTV